MIPYFGKHGAKQYIHGKPIKFGFKLWVMATPLEYCIQFHPYTGKDSILQEYEQLFVGNYDTSPALLRHLNCCNRNDESEPNEKCSIARYGKSEQREA